MINKRDIDNFLKVITSAEWYEIHRIESHAARVAIAKSIANISIEASKNIMRFEQINRVKLWITQSNLEKLDIGRLNPGQIYKVLNRDGYDYLHILEYTLAQEESPIIDSTTTQIDLQEQLKLAVEKEEYAHAARIKRIIEERGLI